MPTPPPRSPFPRQRKTGTPPGEPVVAHACIIQRQRRMIEAYGHVSVDPWRVHVGAQAQAWLDAGAVFSVPWPMARMSPALDLPQAILRFQLLGITPLPTIAPIVNAWAGQRQGWELAYWFTASNPMLPGYARPVDLLHQTPTLLVAVAQHDAHHQRLNQGLGPQRAVTPWPAWVERLTAGPSDPDVPWGDGDGPGMGRAPRRHPDDPFA